MDRLQELVRLHRMKTGSREVARLLGISPNTERAYRLAIAKEGLLEGSPDALPELEALRAAVLRQKPVAQLPPQQRSGVEQWRERVQEWMKKELSPRAIFDRLRTEEATFAGSYPQIKRLCRSIQRERGPYAERVAIPVETAAGEIAQVDFGHVGKLFDSETRTLREAYVFVMVLGHSRRMVTRVVFDQRTETWLQLHVQAFEELGGVVETVVPDNLKAAVVRAAFAVSGPPSELNRSYRELARHYGFKVDPSPPYDAPKKGKVESAVKYVKHSFFRGREKTDIDEVRPALAVWTEQVANARTHGTTHQIPCEVFEQSERAALRALPAQPYATVVWKLASVHTDAHVVFERRLYSVPWRWIGSRVWVRATPTTVMVYADDARVATHDRRGSGLRSTVDEHLPEHRGDLRHRSRAYWEARAERMGADVLSYVREVFDSDDVLSQLRAVQAIVTHLETFPPERASAACRRASHYAAYSYGAIKTILKEALDFAPLPTPTAPSPWSGAAPQFARNIHDLLPARQGGGHERN